MATKNEELQGQSHLVRAVAATLAIKVPAEKEIKFRGSLLRRAAADLADLKPNFLIRLFEAACDADFPDADVISFRQALELHLAKTLGLAAYKTETQPKA